MSWPDAARYANRLSAREGLAPCYSCTWEYICDWYCQIYGIGGFSDWKCRPTGDPYHV